MLKPLIITSYSISKTPPNSEPFDHYYLFHYWNTTKFWNLIILKFWSLLPIPLQYHQTILTLWSSLPIPLLNHHQLLQPVIITTFSITKTLLPTSKTCDSQTTRSTISNMNKYSWIYNMKVPVLVVRPALQLDKTIKYKWCSGERPQCYGASGQRSWPLVYAAVQQMAMTHVFQQVCCFFLGLQTKIKTRCIYTFILTSQIKTDTFSLHKNYMKCKAVIHIHFIPEVVFNKLTWHTTAGLFPRE